MWKRIFKYMQKNITTSRRNNMVIYIVLFPIVLALGMNFFMPAVTETEVKIAVDRGVGEDFIQKLENYGEVEVYDTVSDVKRRVKKVDDVSGIIKQQDQYVVLLEGNEPEAAEEMSRAVLDHILTPAKNVSYQHTTLEDNNNIMKEMGGGLLLLTVILIAGLVVGFNIIEEKETKSVRAISVSPLRLSEFILSHVFLATILGIILAILPGLILVGMTINYWQVITGTICTIGIGLSWGLLIGGFSDNLISAIAIIKSTMIFLVGIPIGSIFVPASLKWIFYPFPNYWAFEVYLNIFNGNQQWISFNNSCLISLAFSLLLIIGISPVLKKRLNMS